MVTDRLRLGWDGPILPRSAEQRCRPCRCTSDPAREFAGDGVDAGTRHLLDRDVMIVRGIQVTTPLRTALDLGRLLWRFDALAAMDGFVLIVVPKQELLHEIERFKGFRGVVQLRDLAPLAEGKAESPGNQPCAFIGTTPGSVHHRNFNGGLR